MPEPIIPQNNLAIFFQKYEIITNPECSVLFSTIAANPSNKEGARVWNFNIGLVCQPTLNDLYQLFIDLSNVSGFGYQISFEGPVLGTISYRNKVVNAGNLISYEYDSINKNITFITRLSCIRANTIVLLSFQINDSSSCKPFNDCSISESDTGLEVNMTYTYNCSSCNFTGPTITYTSSNITWNESTQTATFSTDGTIIINQSGIQSTQCDNCISCSFPSYTQTLTIINESSSSITISLGYSYNLQCRQNPASNCCQLTLSSSSGSSQPTNEICLLPRRSGTLTLTVGPTSATETTSSGSFTTDKPCL